MIETKRGGKRPFRRPRIHKGLMLQIDLYKKKISKVAPTSEQSPVVCFCENGNEHIGSKTTEEILDSQRDYQVDK